ncbi:MAG: ABC transporter permease, partial [Dehalococcoidales bacterium]|nr:ABC transporter permease [Dehalococcoidales bacterium]
MTNSISVAKSGTLFSGLGRMIGAEFLKLRKRSLTKILMFILAGIIALVNLLLLAISKVTLPAGRGQDLGNLSDLMGLSSGVPFALSLMASFGVVLAIILSASSMGSEYNWKTIRTALISSESRFKFLTAKLISLGLMILIGMVVGVVVGIIMSLITNAIGGYTFDFSFLTGSYIWQQFLQFWRTFFTIIPFALLAFMMSIVGRSAMPGISTGIGVLFLESLITTFMRLAGGWIAKVPDYLLNANVQAITALNQLPRGFGRMGVSTTGDAEPSLTHAY